MSLGILYRNIHDRHQSAFRYYLCGGKQHCSFFSFFKKIIRGFVMCKLDCVVNFYFVLWSFCRLEVHTLPQFTEKPVRLQIAQHTMTCEAIDFFFFELVGSVALVMECRWIAVFLYIYSLNIPVICRIYQMFDDEEFVYLSDP